MSAEHVAQAVSALAGAMLVYLMLVRRLRGPRPGRLKRLRDYLIVVVSAFVAVAAFRSMAQGPVHMSLENVGVGGFAEGVLGWLVLLVADGHGQIPPHRFISRHNPTLTI